MKLTNNCPTRTVRSLAVEGPLDVGLGLLQALLLVLLKHLLGHQLNEISIISVVNKIVYFQLCLTLLLMINKKEKPGTPITVLHILLYKIVRFFFL